MKTKQSQNVAVVLITSILAACTSIPAQKSDDALNARLDALQVNVEKLAALIGKVEERTRPPTQLPKSVDVPFADNPKLGSESATIGVVEFSDYQCPYCGKFHAAVFPELKKNYIDTGKVLFVSRDSPMEFHPMAEPAAVAANCAGQQDAYYAVQQDLYAHQDRYGNDFYVEVARNHTLDIPRFEQCLRDPEQLKEIRGDSTYARELGVDGTPTFFVGRVEGNRLINATPIVGAQPYAVFAQWMERYLGDQSASHETVTH